VERGLVLGFFCRQLPAFDRHVIADVLPQIELWRRQQLDERAAQAGRIAGTGNGGTRIEIQPERGRCAAGLHAPDPRRLGGHVGGVFGLGLRRLSLQQDNGGGKKQHGGTLRGG